MARDNFVKVKIVWFFSSWCHCVKEKDANCPQFIHWNFSYLGFPAMPHNFACQPLGNVVSKMAIWTTYWKFMQFHDGCQKVSHLFFLLGHHWDRLGSVPFSHHTWKVKIFDTVIIQFKIHGIFCVLEENWLWEPHLFGLLEWYFLLAQKVHLCSSWPKSALWCLFKQRSKCKTFLFVEKFGPKGLEWPTKLSLASFNSSFHSVLW